LKTNLEVWYEGELRRDLQTLTYESDDGWFQVAGLGEHLDENMVKMHYLMSRDDDTLGIMPLIERYDLQPTSHDHVFVEENIGRAAIQQGRRIANELQNYVILFRVSAEDLHPDVAVPSLLRREVNVLDRQRVHVDQNRCLHRLE